MKIPPMHFSTTIKHLASNANWERRTGESETFENEIIPAYVEFSTNWEAPEDIPLGPKKVQKILNSSSGVLRNFVDSSKKKAVVVAGLHATTHDPQPHITVRLNNENNQHVYTYHVYVNKSGGYSGQTQTWP
jgi:hypothetical protein